MVTTHLSKGNKVNFLDKCNYSNLAYLLASVGEISYCKMSVFTEQRKTQGEKGQEVRLSSTSVCLS